MEKKHTEWIAVDWGTTHLRAWVFGPNNIPMNHLVSDNGMGCMQRQGFEKALVELVNSHLPDDRKTIVVCCGMVGSRQGWVEAAYASAPCPPPGAEQAVRLSPADPRLDVFILPGVKQNKPAQVMRGEETQIAGFLAKSPDFDGVICLPGTHTKWVRISAGEIVSFETYMTGELFSLLSEQSVIKHGLAGDGWDDQAFEKAVHDGMARPQALAQIGFTLRAEFLLNALPAAHARARLSGFLIGAELQGARAYWLGQNIALIGSEMLTGLYETALDSARVRVEKATGDEMNLAGLAAAHSRLKEAAI